MSTRRTLAVLVLGASLLAAPAAFPQQGQAPSQGAAQRQPLQPGQQNLAPRGTLQQPGQTAVPPKPGPPPSPQAPQGTPAPTRPVRLPPRAGIPEAPPLVDPAGASARERSAPRQVLVGVTGDAPEGAARRIARAYGLELMGERRLASVDLRVLRLRVPDTRELEALLEILRLDPGVVAAQRNYRYYLSESGDARGTGLQYAFAKLRLGAAHRYATGRGVRVAVVDSGVDAAHPALAGGVAETLDLLGERAVPAEDHGTAVAGIIAARGELRGVAPDAHLLALRAFAETGESGGPGRSASYVIAQALDLAYARGAEVMNLSFSGPRDPLVARVVRAALGAGAVVVAAAGNGGPEAGPAYPAALPGVIAVTAVDAEDALYEHATRGPQVSVAAPGVRVLAAVPAGSYRFMSGTSMAAAHVSGLVALLLERHRDLESDRVRALLEASAQDLGPTGRDPLFGAGRVDAGAALERLADRGAAGS